MAEDELDGIIDKSTFFEILGYTIFGVDVRKQYRIVGNRKKADYVCLDEYQNVIFIMESKKPLDENLEDALDQLWKRYVLPLKSKYGVLINGIKLIIYKRLIGGECNKIKEYELNQISQIECNYIYTLIKKPEYEITNYDRIQAYFKELESYSLKEEISQEYFFEAFKLHPNSTFGILINNFLSLFFKIYSESKFLMGAYNFWIRSLASKPEKIPPSWKPFLKKEKDIFPFMFCLETAHALLARLILAKACEDLDFPEINISEFTLSKINHYRNNIPLLGYPIVLINLLKEMRDRLIYSIFEEDIFSWWDDAFSKFKNTTSVELLQISEPTLENFSESIAKIILVLYKFNFSQIAGDPLGDLYQYYFDNETRKALGEFYTPTEIVEYILNSVGYKYIQNKRLLDPACGSGTFLVQALKRYLKEAESKAEKHGWAYVLKDLCNKPKIVGFDIHPFACLIAQVRFMLELMPYYKKAIEEEKLLVFHSLQRLPIFRTDSLELEMIPHEFRKTPLLVITEEDIKFNISLPLQLNGNKSIFMEVIIPTWKILSIETNFELYDLDEYFCLIQGIFDAIKSILKVNGNEIPEIVIKAHLQKYLENKDYNILSKYFKKYADDIINNLIALKSEVENGRLIKTVEDSILSAILKNYIKYNFVVGNPPYVRVHRLSSDKKDYYKKMYDSPFGKFDIYIIFIERGVKWLTEDGSLGYILSNMYIKRDYGVNIRKYLVGFSSIRKIIDFGVSGVFKDVTNYPCILILNKRKRDENFIKCVRIAKPILKNGKDNTLEYIEKKIHNDCYEDDYIDIFKYDQNKLNSNIWKIMPSKEENIFNNIEKNSIRLKLLRKNIYRAIQTGYDEAYIINKKIIDQHNLEHELIKPILKGSKNVHRWKITWDGKYLIFPYKIKNNNLLKINIENYQNTLKYFKTYENKIIERKWYGKKIVESGRQWFELWNPIIFDKPKIVVPEISKGRCFSFDNNFYCAGKVFSIFLKRENDISLYLYILALLNSKVLDFYFKHIASVKQGYYYENMKNALDQLPIKDPSFNDKIFKDIINNVKNIMEIVNVEKDINNFPDSYFKKNYLSGIEFDKISYVFQKNIECVSPITKQDNNHTYQLYLEPNSTPIILDSKEKLEFFLIFINKLTKIKEGDVFNMLMPKSTSIIREILKKYNKDIEKYKEIEIEIIEEKINKLIYKLYGIKKESQKIIDNYLKKF